MSDDFNAFFFKVKASADISVPGKMNSSVHMSVNGKDRVILDCLMSHSVLEGTRNARLELNFTQSVLPTVTNLFANISANLSLERLSQYSLRLCFVLFAHISSNQHFDYDVFFSFFFYLCHFLFYFSIFLCGSFSYGPRTLLAQVKGSLKTSRSLRLSLSADLRHSMPSRSILPTNLDGAVGQSHSFTEGWPF